MSKIYSRESGLRENDCLQSSPKYLLPVNEALLRKIEPTGGCLQYTTEMITSKPRNHLLRLNDKELLVLCKCTTFRSTGPGGQHRNTTDTAVRLVLKGTSLMSYATKSRSQKKNKDEAIKKMRLRIAFCMREQESCWDESWCVGKKDRRYPLLIGVLFDKLTEAQFSIGKTGKVLGISTGKLIRLLSSNPQVWRVVQQERLSRGLRTLKT